LVPTSVVLGVQIPKGYSLTDVEFSW